MSSTYEVRNVLFCTAAPGSLNHTSVFCDFYFYVNCLSNRLQKTRRCPLLEVLGLLNYLGNASYPAAIKPNLLTKTA